MRILVVNSGSSSLKLRIVEDDDAVSRSDDLAALGQGTAPDLAAILKNYGPIDAVGHRVVHGGTSFAGPAILDEAVVSEIRRLADLAPLHQPKALAALDAVNQTFPGIPAVASFDTAFHSGLPAAAATYALPREWRQRWGLRRYGFHGLSHSYAARRAGELLSRSPAGPLPLGLPPVGLRLVTCHLGAGASLTAILDGRSVDTTMGFTPLEGLVMATRSGSVDPGMLLWLQSSAGMLPDELADGLENRSGLAGLAGTSDMREVLAAIQRGSPHAELALDVYLHRLRAGIAAMAASLGGIDCLVFTGGIGENSPVVRERAIDRLGFLGLALDGDRNQGTGDREIGRAGGVSVLVVLSREDLQIAREVRSCLGA